MSVSVYEVNLIQSRSMKVFHIFHPVDIQREPTTLAMQTRGHAGGFFFTKGERVSGVFSGTNPGRSRLRRKP
jgi:hypothetical protein